MQKQKFVKKIKTLVSLFLSLCLLAGCLVFLKNVRVQAASYAKVIEVKLKDGQDATSEIQKALDEAAKAGTKKKQAMVKVPAGTYYINKTLVIGSNTYLKLDAKTYMKKSPNPKDPIHHMLHAVKGKKGKFSDNSNITVQGGTWDAEFIHYNEKTGGSVFMFAHTNKLKILDVTLCNCYGSHLLELGGVKNCTVKNCEFYGFKAPDSDTEKEAIQLDVCHNESILPYGDPYDDTPCEKITITGCNIHDYSRAVGSHMMVEGIYHKTIKITDNNFHDLDKAAVYGYNYTNLTIKGNKITNVGCGIQLKTDSKVSKTKLERNKGVKAMKVSKGEFKLTIQDNTIKLTQKLSAEDKDSGNSMGIFIYGSETYPMKKATIKNNTIVSGSAGVYLRYVNSATITGNNIDRYDGAFGTEETKFAEDAIKLLSSSDAVITDNNISGKCSVPFENGIALREGSKNVSVSNNSIPCTNKSGIGLYDSSSITSGSGNSIKNAGLNGITVIGSSLTLSDSTISKTSQHGISIQSGASLNLNNVVVDSAASNGLNISSSSKVVMAGGSVTKSGAKGVNIYDGSSFSAQGTEISYSGGKGVDVGNDTTVKLDSCKIFGGGANGAFVDGNTDTTITDCSIYDNSGNALQLKNGKIKVTGNTFTNNCKGESDGKAVAVFSGISGEISGNTFSNPGTKSELWITSEAKLSPSLSTVKTASAYGYTDAAGNSFR